MGRSSDVRAAPHMIKTKQPDLGYERLRVRARLHPIRDPLEIGRCDRRRCEGVKAHRGRGEGEGFDPR